MGTINITNSTTGTVTSATTINNSFNVPGVSSRPLPATPVVDEGQKITKSFAITKMITKIVVNGMMNVNIDCGPDAEMSVTATERKMDYIECVLVADTLTIGMKENAPASFSKIAVQITIPVLVAIQANGSGTITAVADFESEELRVNVSGQTDINISGFFERVFLNTSGNNDAVLNNSHGKYMEVESSGTGEVLLQGRVTDVKIKNTGNKVVKAKHLITSTLTVHNTGNGDVSAYAKISADISLTGNGSVTIGGNPAKQSQQRTGNGHIRFTD